MWWARHSQRRAEPAPHAEARKPHVTYPHDSRDPPSGLAALTASALQRLPPPWPTCPSALPGSQDAASGRNTDGKEATCPRPLGGRAPAFPPTGARSLRRPGSQDPHGTPPPSPGARPRPGSQDTGGPGAARTEHLTTCPAPHGPRPAASCSRRLEEACPTSCPATGRPGAAYVPGLSGCGRGPAPPEAAGPQSGSSGYAADQNLQSPEHRRTQGTLPTPGVSPGPAGS